MTTTLCANTKTKLLLVDDDPAMVRLLSRVIDRSFGEKIALHSLTDPAKARDVIERDLIDILVTDLDMPGINGLGLLRCAKRNNALTQVLFVTGRSSVDALIDALELGATDYLLKPLDQGEMLELLGQAQKRVERWRHALAGTLQTRKYRAPVADEAVEPAGIVPELVS